MLRGAHPPGRAREIAVLVIGVTNREQPQPVVDDNVTSLSAATVDAHLSTTTPRRERDELLSLTGEVAGTARDAPLDKREPAGEDNSIP